MDFFYMMPVPASSKSKDSHCRSGLEKLYFLSLGGAMQKWALITGATAGIGKATAKKLAKKGWSLILTGRREERLSSLIQELDFPPSGGQVLTFKMDIQDSQQILSLFQEYAHELSQVELLINNAGLAKGTSRLQEAQPEDWDQMIDTNIKGLLFLTRQILPKMIQNKRGHIINLGSVAGRWVYPGGAVYCATKFAVRAISEGLRMDLIGTPIRVSNVEPGMVETEFSQVRFGDAEKAKQVYAGMKPLTADDIAETIVWIAERPPHVNIQELVIFPTDQASIRDVHRKGD